MLARARTLRMVIKAVWLYDCPSACTEIMSELLRSKEASRQGRLQTSGKTERFGTFGISEELFGQRRVKTQGHRFSISACEKRRWRDGSQSKGSILVTAADHVGASKSKAS